MDCMYIRPPVRTILMATILDTYILTSPGVNLDDRQTEKMTAKFFPQIYTLTIVHALDRISHRQL